MSFSYFNKCVLKQMKVILNVKLRISIWLIFINGIRVLVYKPIFFVIIEGVYPLNLITL